MKQMSQPLEYEASLSRRSTWQRFKAALAGVALSIVITLPAIFLAVVSGGGGEGHYTFARALFPLPMLLTRIEGDSIGPLSVTLALAQFPIYGGAIGWFHFSRYPVPLLTFLSIVLIHVLAAVVCFSGAIPNFS